MLRSLILGIANVGWFRRLATRTAPGRALAGRFVAGETLVEALAVARDLHRPGHACDAQPPRRERRLAQAALEAREAYLAEIAAVAAAPELDAIVSVKLTQLGLDDSVDACWANVEAILTEAGASGTTVEIDMEDHGTVDATLEIVRRANERLPGTGVAIQAYLRRSAEDVFALPPRVASVS